MLIGGYWKDYQLKDLQWMVSLSTTTGSMVFWQTRWYVTFPNVVIIIKHLIPGSQKDNPNDIIDCFPDQGEEATWSLPCYRASFNDDKLVW